MEVLNKLTGKTNAGPPPPGLASMIVLSKKLTKEVGAELVAKYEASLGDIEKRAAIDREVAELQEQLRKEAEKEGLLGNRIANARGLGYVGVAGIITGGILLIFSLQVAAIPLLIMGGIVGLLSLAIWIKENNTKKEKTKETSEEFITKVRAITEPQVQQSTAQLHTPVMEVGSVMDKRTMSGDSRSSSHSAESVRKENLGKESLKTKGVGTEEKVGTLTQSTTEAVKAKTIKGK